MGELAIRRQRQIGSGLPNSSVGLTSMSLCSSIVAPCHCHGLHGMRTLVRVRWRGHEWDSVMAKEVPRLLLPFPRDRPPPLFRQTVDISCGVGVVVAQAQEGVNLVFFWLRLWATHWAILWLQSRIACCTATAALTLPAWWRLQMSMP